MSVLDSSDRVLTVHAEGDVVTVRCAGRRGPIRLTWTGSARGHEVLHYRCYHAREKAS